MKQIFITIMLFFTSTITFAHEGESRVSIEPESTAQYTAGQFNYGFQLYDNDTKKVLTVDDLNESHTKKLHFIAYDPALKAFTHVHPEFDGQIWNVSLNLSVNGQYFLWAQGELLDKTEFSSMARATIAGGQAENPILPLGDIRTGSDQGTQIKLASTKIKVGKMAMLNFTISRIDGTKPVLTDYLGAFAHVISTPADGDALNHVHPMAGSKPNTGILHATFDDPGYYRIWVQLVDGGVLKTIPLSVTVTK